VSALAYKVIESSHWVRDDGRTASTYGACPWPCPSEKTRWRVEPTGWTVKNPLTGEVGMGHAPFSTREQAEAFALRLGRPSAIGMGD
jgi:hypothetical protein